MTVITEPIVANVVEHLRKLGRGDVKPLEPMNGICYEVSKLFGFGYLRLGRCFEAMGLDDVYPIGRDGTKPWVGAAGRKRRAFCLELADFIEANPKVFLED